MVGDGIMVVLHDRSIVRWRFHCTGKVNLGLITNVVSHSCAVKIAITTDPGMGRVSQLDVLLSVYPRMLDRVVFLARNDNGWEPVTSPSCVAG